MILSDICKFIVDCPHSTAEDEGEGIPLIRTPNIGKGRFVLEGVHRVCESVYNQRCARAIPQDDDIIFAREAPAGNAAIIKNGQKVCLGQRTVLIRPDAAKVIPDYLVYYLLAPEQQYKLLGTANGATVAHVNLPTIREMKVDNLPPLPVQRRIADILSAYDDLIENNRKQIKLLEEAAQRLYKEWFIDLRFPGHEHTPIINGVPEGWKKTLLSNLIEIKYGKDHKGIADGNIPVYGSGGLMRKCEKTLYTGEAILIPRKGSLNNIMYVNEAFWTVDTMFYALPKQCDVGFFVYFFLRTLDMYSLDIGSAVPSMTTSILNSLETTLPTPDWLVRFQKILYVIFSQISTLRHENSGLMEERDRLLAKVMIHKVTVY